LAGWVLLELTLKVSGPQWSIDTEDILAIGAAIVAIIIAIGIALGNVDVVKGGTIITACVGTAGIAQVIKSRRKTGRKR
jgi:hypothetical protein